ncbi:hypothetical protein [Streptomyces sp. WMMC897]|uniref:hypothetical protein n=1 Tax=Streptomyces sp. WMMC897 TaxID=3014782 RepID=UPI0022B7177A|nr:hypothetical protein [Streptomyces sp. WMMC897]MCZ7415671.1 hypothetical protein [Streptomyces sp. WMMC897]
MSEPIVYADQWRTVMTAARWRCQCTGACGNTHTKGGSRCPRQHDRHAGKHRSPVRLLAAPADPGVPTVRAVALPVEALRAWCPDCLDAAHRTARRTAPTDPAQSGLFDL